MNDTIKPHARKLTLGWREVSPQSRDVSRRMLYEIKGLAVVGLVEYHKDRIEHGWCWYWEVRVDQRARAKAGQIPCGYAPLVGTAASIVEKLVESLVEVEAS